MTEEAQPILSMSAQAKADAYKETLERAKRAEDRLAELEESSKRDTFSIGVLADGYEATVAALKAAGIETDDPTAGVRELAAQRDRYWLRLSEHIEDHSPQPPSDKAPAPEPARCDVLDPTCGYRCAREAGHPGMHARDDSEGPWGEPAEAEPSAPRPGWRGETVIPSDDGPDEPRLWLGLDDQGDLYVGSLRSGERVCMHATRLCTANGGGARQDVRAALLPFVVPRTPETAEPAPTRDGRTMALRIRELLDADALGSETPRERIEAFLDEVLAAEPAPTRDESAPPPGWYFEEDEHTAKVDRSVVLRDSIETDTLAEAWELYDAEHGYARDLAAAQETIRRLTEERDVARRTAADQYATNTVAYVDRREGLEDLRECADELFGEGVGEALYPDGWTP